MAHSRAQTSAPHDISPSNYRAMLHNVSQKYEKMIYECMDTAAMVVRVHAELEQLTDSELKAKTSEFRERLANGETLDDLLVEAFAVVREVRKKVRQVMLASRYTLVRSTRERLPHGLGGMLASSRRFR